MTLEDGETVIEADVLEAGQAVFIVSDDERIPLPVGEYTTADGQTIVVTEEGMISEVKLEVEDLEEEEEEMEKEDDKEMLEEVETMIDEERKDEIYEGALHEAFLSTLKEEQKEQDIINEENQILHKRKQDYLDSMINNAASFLESEKEREDYVSSKIYDNVIKGLSRHDLSELGNVVDKKHYKDFSDLYFD